MSDAEKIAEMLRVHAQVRGYRDMQVHCECGWTQVSRMSDRAGRHADHQAEMVAAALEPADVEREKVAWAAGFKQGGPMHDVNYDDPDAHTRNPYDTKEEA